MTRTEEIQYLGQMLTATTDADLERLGSIIERLRVLYMQVKPRPDPGAAPKRPDIDNPVA